MSTNPHLNKDVPTASDIIASHSGEIDPLGNDQGDNDEHDWRSPSPLPFTSWANSVLLSDVHPFLSRSSSPIPSIQDSLAEATIAQHKRVLNVHGHYFLALPFELLSIIVAYLTIADVVQLVQVHPVFASLRGHLYLTSIRATIAAQYPVDCDTWTQRMKPVTVFVNNGRLFRIFSDAVMPLLRSKQQKMSATQRRQLLLWVLSNDYPNDAEMVYELVKHLLAGYVLDPHVDSTTALDAICAEVINKPRRRSHDATTSQTGVFSAIGPFQSPTWLDGHPATTSIFAVLKRALRSVASTDNVRLIVSLVSWLRDHAPNHDGVNASVLSDVVLRGYHHVFVALLQEPTLQWSAMAVSEAMRSTASTDRRDFAETLFELVPVLVDLTDIEVMQRAARAGHLAFARFAVDKGFTPGDCTAGSPLIIACRSNSVDLVHLLVEVGGVNPSGDNNLALLNACRLNCTEMVEYLLRCDAVDAGARQNLALRYAVKTNAVPIVKMLVARSDVDGAVSEFVCLRMAAAHDSSDVFLLLFRAINTAYTRALKKARLTHAPRPPSPFDNMTAELASELIMTRLQSDGLAYECVRLLANACPDQVTEALSLRHFAALVVRAPEELALMRLFDALLQRKSSEQLAVKAASESTLSEKMTVIEALWRVTQWHGVLDRLLKVCWLPPLKDMARVVIVENWDPRNAAFCLWVHYSMLQVAEEAKRKKRLNVFDRLEKFDFDQLAVDDEGMVLGENVVDKEGTEKEATVEHVNKRARLELSVLQDITDSREATTFTDMISDFDCWDASSSAVPMEGVGEEEDMVELFEDEGEDGLHSDIREQPIKAVCPWYWGRDIPTSVAILFSLALRYKLLGIATVVVQFHSDLLWRGFVKHTPEKYLNDIVAYAWSVLCRLPGTPEAFSLRNAFALQQYPFERFRSTFIPLQTHVAIMPQAPLTHGMSTNKQAP